MAMMGKFRPMGESTYYTKFLPNLEEAAGGAAYEIAHEAGKKRLIVHTDRIDDEKLEQVKNVINQNGLKNVGLKQYNHNIEISWEDINKYAECKTVIDIYAVDPERNEQGRDIFPHFITYDLTSDGKWWYLLPELTGSGTDPDGYIFGSNKTITGLHVFAPKAKHWICGNQRSINLRKVTGNLDSVTNGQHAFHEGYVLSEFYVALPKLSAGYCMFNYCILNKASTLCILNSLRTYTTGNHPLNIGIHIDHKYDPEINFALKMADGNYEPLNLPIDEETGEFLEPTENKGWTLTIQWNGTVTENAYPAPQTTFSLKPQIIPIYAKVGEIKHFNGEKEIFLDWGHYVTDWEENGYQEFSSLEEAYEYFGLEVPKKEIEI